MSDQADTRALRALMEGATPGPWKWTPGDGQPQIEGSVEAPDMNPVLIAHGCGNEMATTAGVTGCMPEKLNDELRACPLHPSAPDRDLIVALVNAAPALLDEVDGLRARVAELESTEEDLRGLTRDDIHSLRKVRDFMEDRDDLWPESMTIEEAVRDMDKRNGQLLESWNEYHETIWEVRSYFGVADDDNALLEGYVKAREWLARRAEKVAELEREVERVREALLACHDWRGLCDADANETYERIAEMFRCDTGMLRPGKDAPSSYAHTTEVRHAEWNRWVDRKNGELDAQIRAALAPRAEVKP